MSLSTLRARVPLLSLSSLTDDSLLVILRHLSVPQLLELLTASRRINSPIVQYSFSRYRSIAMPKLYCKYRVQQVLFSRRFHAYTTIYKTGLIFQGNTYPGSIKNRQLYKSRLSSFPLHLPDLFPRLESFAFSYKLEDERKSLSEEETLINRLLSGFLRSTWSGTLVSLELNVTKAAHPAQSNETFYSALNQLSALRHLFLRFLFPAEADQMPFCNIPDCMPVLGQLVSFSMHHCHDANMATLLGQLGPHLAHLSLSTVDCSEADFVAFLRSKPSYKATLRTLDLSLFEFGIFNFWECPKVATLARYCPSLEIISHHSPVNGQLFAFFETLSRLSHLQEIGIQLVTIAQLRALRDTPRFRLPRVTSLRRFSLRIDCEDTDFQATELFDEHLALLGAILCAVECIEIHFRNPPIRGNRNATLSEQLGVKMKEHFPSARICRGEYSTLGLPPA